jgi:hypothetical protein
MNRLHQTRPPQVKHKANSEQVKVLLDHQAKPARLNSRNVAVHQFIFRARSITP